MEQRMREIRNKRGYSMIKVAELIGISDSAYSKIERGINNPAPRTVELFCQKLGVSVHWLRTGEGEMFREVSREDELAAFFGDLLSGEPDFRRRFISVLARFSPDDWKAMELLSAKLHELWDEVKAEDNKKADL